MIRILCSALEGLHRRILSSTSSEHFPSAPDLSVPEVAPGDVHLAPEALQATGDRAGSGYDGFGQRCRETPRCQEPALEIWRKLSILNIYGLISRRFLNCITVICS